MIGREMFGGKRDDEDAVVKKKKSIRKYLSVNSLNFGLTNNQKERKRKRTPQLVQIKVS